MTVQTDPIRELTVDELIELSWNESGMLTAGKHPSPEEYALGHKLLELELGALQLEGHMLRERSSTTLAFTSGTSQYYLPTDVIDVFTTPNDVAGTIVDSSGGAETLVMVMGMGEWMSLSNKTLTNNARPSKVLIEKFDRVRLTFWPVPDSTVTSFRYTKIGFVRGTMDGSKTIDVVRTWQKYLMYAVAAEICAASSLPLDRVGFFAQRAAEQKAKCLANDQETGNTYFRPVGYRRR